LLKALLVTVCVGDCIDSSIAIHKKITEKLGGNWIQSSQNSARQWK